MVETKLLYQFVNQNKEFVFIVNNQFFTQIDWGDGSPFQIITDPTTHSYHKYVTSSVYKVTFTSPKPIAYKWFTSPLNTNGYGYLINCSNDPKYYPEFNIHDTVKLNYTFTEQGYASDKIKKIKDKTIYADLKSKGLTIQKPYSSYESQLNTLRGNIYCNYDSIYVFQI